MAEAKRFEAEVDSKLMVGEGFSGEGVGLRSDGAEFPGHFSFNRLPNGGLLCVCRNESERLSTLMSLQTQNSLLSALLENLRIGVMFEDAVSPQELLRNQSAVDLLGVDDVELEATAAPAGFFECLRTRCHTDVARERLEELLGLRGAAYNVQLLLDEDTYLIIDRIPVFVGSINRGVLWTIRDVTDQKRQERMMEEDRQRAEAGDRAKSTFSGEYEPRDAHPRTGSAGWHAY